MFAPGLTSMLAMSADMPAESAMPVRDPFTKSFTLTVKHIIVPADSKGLTSSVVVVVD